MMRRIAVSVRSSRPARWSPERLLLRSNVEVEKPVDKRDNVSLHFSAGWTRP